MLSKVEAEKQKKDSLNQWLTPTERRDIDGEVIEKVFLF